MLDYPRLTFFLALYVAVIVSLVFFNVLPW